MIPDFKTYVRESFWGDVHKRSRGDEIRKEDDVNLLDLNEFYRYIKDQYKTKVEYIDLDAMGGGNGDVLGVDITENVILFYKPKRGHILLSWSRVKIPMPFFDELIDRFKVENPNAMRRIITEKDGSCTNKTFVDVIEFFLGHKDGLVNESFWGDVHKRSRGDDVRKEDDINFFDKERFAEYLSELYSTTYFDLKNKSDENKLCLPILKPRHNNPDGWAFNLTLKYDNPLSILLSDDFGDYYPELYKKLQETFTVKIEKRKCVYIVIYPQNEGKVTNQFYIDVLNFIIDNVENKEELIIKRN